MPQHEHMERHAKLHGRRFDSEERERKKEARLVHKRSEFSQKVHGIRAKLYHQKRLKEKATMRKTMAMHNERNNKHANDDAIAEGAVPAYLLDRQGVSRAKVLSNTIKQKRKDKAGKWEVPIPKVKPVADDEMFKVLRTGSKKQKVGLSIIAKRNGMVYAVVWLMSTLSIQHTRSSCLMILASHTILVILFDSCCNSFRLGNVWLRNAPLSVTPLLVRIPNTNDLFVPLVCV